MTIEEHNKAVVRRWVEIVNERNVDLIDDVLAENFISRQSGRSRDDHKHELTEGWFKQRPTLKLSIDAMIAEGDTVATRGTWHEDGQDPLLYLGFARLVNRKVVDHWHLAEPEKDA
jgi:predicted SnoaL-like aldol condensation-catalyzing enzyme